MEIPSRERKRSSQSRATLVIQGNGRVVRKIAAQVAIPKIIQHQFSRAKEQGSLRRQSSSKTENSMKWRQSKSKPEKIYW